MRMTRIVGAEGTNYYHCMSRVIERRFIFEEEEKEYFVRIMRLLANFSGVKVLTYCIMSNHFHLLLEVSDEEAALFSDRELIRRLKYLYDEDDMRVFKMRLKTARKSGDPELLERVRGPIEARMFDMSIFMRELKQRFTQWYNRRTQRVGPLWEGRFRSVLVSGEPEALYMMGLYIELNPLRAGLCEDVKDYRWCGYGAALGGEKSAMDGVSRLIAAIEGGRPDGMREEVSGWGAVCDLYRRWLFGASGPRGVRADGRPVKLGVSEERIAAVLAGKGRLSRSELLGCRVRYMSDGLAFGGKTFVEGVFERYRGCFGEKRKRGARKMKGGDWGELVSMRDLRVSPLG